MVCIVISSEVVEGVVSLTAPVGPLISCPDAKVEQAASHSAGSHACRMLGILRYVKELDSTSVTGIWGVFED
jgi:hypothetical protein